MSATTDDELIRAARTSWDEHFDRPPLQMGVEEGIVWAVVESPTVGVCGYACVPAESHAWSARFPRGEDSREEELRSRKYMRLIHEIIERRGGGRDPEDMAAVFEEAKQAEGYEEPPDDLRMDDFLDAHGGITYYQHPWVGFDTGHAWDYWPPEYDPSGITQMYIGRQWPNDPLVRRWTVDMVADEAKRLARQIAEIARLETQLEIGMEGDGG